MEGPKMARHLPRRLKGGLGAAAALAVFGLMAATAAMTVGAWTYSVQTWTYTGSTQTANAQAGQTIHDTALVSETSGRYMQSGYLVFDLYSNSSCSGTPIQGPHQPYTSNGSSTTASFTSPNEVLPSSITTATTYEWVATFYNTTESTVWSSTCGQEPVYVCPIPEAFGITTLQAETQVQPGGSISDTATVSSVSGSSRSLPAGTVIFNLYTASNCTSSVTLSNGVVNFAGSTSSSAGVNGPSYSVPTSITSPMTYYWTAAYKVGSTTEATSGCAAEPVQVVHQGAVSTVPLPSSGKPGTALSDSATVTGIVDPASTDTVTFSLYLADPSDPASCTAGTLVENFGASSLQGGSSGPWTATSKGSNSPTAAGTYLWQVQFNAVNDPNNLSSAVFCGEPVTITSPVGGQLAASTTTTPITGSGLGSLGLIGGLAVLMGALTLFGASRVRRLRSIV